MVWAGDFQVAQKEPDRMAAQATAREALNALGRGFDVTLDLRLAYCKGPQGSRLIELDEDMNADVVIPGGVIIPNVPKDIKCDKGERTHFRSEVLPFHQMSERFNQGLSISGKMPLGLFNTMYSFNGTWQADASATKTLALDGWFITLYNMQIKTLLCLKDEVKKAVPSFWEPAALARFIEKYGTHVIVSVKIGGKDVVYIKQHQSSPLSSGEIQKYLKKIADQRFAEGSGQNMFDTRSKEKTSDPLTPANHAHRLQLASTYTSSSFTAKEDVEVIFRRRGGDNLVKHHNDWLATVPSAPDVISMSFVPITSLLNGVPGSGFLSHAVNLYLRCTILY
ncbi:hypothetical protein O6H91_Y214900 [Diphasiastrum complanatum]|nr:hypothetical protein O6H91_Y214900 [Diphasiastrum complanatum]